MAAPVNHFEPARVRLRSAGATIVLVVSILMPNKSLIIFSCCLLSPQVQVYLMYVEHKSRIDLHDVPVSSIYCYVDYQHAVLGDLHD